MELVEKITARENAIFWMAVCVVFLVVFIPIIKKIKTRRLIKLVTSLNRGTQSERDLVLRLLKRGTPPITIFHDLCIAKNNGKFSQIDIAMVTTEGIIVFEVKDFSGWIFGNGNHSHWTKVLAYGKRKYRFYNPIRQNRSHIAALKTQLQQFKNIPFFSVIVFYGKCELKEINYIPEGTYLVKPHRLNEVLNQIKKNNDPAPYTDKHEVIRFFEQAVEYGENMNVQEKHVEDIKDLVGKHRIYD